MRRVDAIAMEIATRTLSTRRSLDDATWAVARIRRLEAALSGLRRGVADLVNNPCFCECAIRNPMMAGEHSAACRAAAAALREDF